MNIFSTLFSKSKNRKRFAVLIDPDKSKIHHIDKIIDVSITAQIDFFLIGGSLLSADTMDECIKLIKAKTAIPVIIFPGNTMQINEKADAILFLSLISGRNPEMLIGKHVEAAPYIKALNIEPISTGYMIIDNGKPSTVSYMSNSLPIPYDKNDIAVCTAMAGEMLGMKMIFMDAGSGASKPVSEAMVSKVKSSITVPLIIGGGITNGAVANALYKAGADILVVGNAIEENADLIYEVVQERNKFNLM